MKGERRRFQRLKISGTIKVFKKGLLSKGEPIHVHISDISRAGAKIISAMSLDQDLNVILSFKSKDMINAIELKGKTIWSRPLDLKGKQLFMTGVKFSKTCDKEYEDIATMLIAHLG
ncbi:MAG: PilZ domain-containing protein [Candidatus Aureabacteria bacterium]|nr:PilZ domain-containing protein [Candidatus Auribacterota bacterium]